MLGVAGVSYNTKRAVPGSNPLIVNVHASNCRSIAKPDYSCSICDAAETRE
jgi:hypothetical protein